MDTFKPMGGTVALMAGGTKGIGRATALELARLGANIVLVGRTKSAGEEVVAQVQALGGKATFMQADLSQMSEVRRIAEEFKRNYQRLDILVHSADILTTKRVESVEGIEKSFALNYLSRFLLDNLLLDLLKASTPARIIHVAAAGISGKLALEHIPPGPKLGGFTSHNVGQRANDVFGIELAERLEGSGVTINIMNPGIVGTDIRRNVSDNKLLVTFMELVLRPVTKTSEQFAQRVVHYAASAEVSGLNGRLIAASGKILTPKPVIQDVRVRQQLWSMSERLTGLTEEVRAT